MSYGLQISASGAMTALYRQDVLANNLANMDTAGFKPDVPSTRPRDAVRREDSLPFLPSNALLERLGAGVLLNPNRVNFTQGALRISGNPLDVAIQGQGFFAVRDSTDADVDTIRLTRDGRFALDASGTLVTATGGLPVLDSSNRTIRLAGTGPVTIDADGTILQDGSAVARLRLLDVPDTSRLRKAGTGLFEAPSDALAAAFPASGSVRQHAFEDSGVDEVRTLLDITSAGRDADANLAMIQHHDRMLDRAINQLGRVT